MPATAGAIRAGRAFVELFADDSRLVRGLRAASAKLKAWGRSVSALGMQMLRMAAAAAVPIAFATRTYASFADQMATVRAVTGATADAFDHLNEQAKELGRTTSYTAAQVAGAMTELGRAGFTPDEIGLAISAMLSLARATGTELPEAAGIAAAALRGFNLDASEMTRVADVLVATANNSAQTLIDVGESLKYAAPIAAETGESIESVAKALGTMANMGIKGTMAGTTFRNIILQLSNPQTQKALDDIGVSAIDAAGNLRPIGDVLLEVGKAMSNLGSAQRMALAEQLFGRRAIGGALKLSTQQFEQLNKAIDDAAGTAKRTADTMDNTLGGAFRRLWSAVEGIQIAIGEVLAPVLDDWSSTLTTVAGLMTTWIKENKSAVILTLKLTTATLAVGAAFVAAGTSLTLAGIAVGGFAMAIGAVSTLLGALTSPLGLTVAAIAGVVHYSGAGGKALEWLGGKFGELRDFASKAWGGIGDAIAAGDLSLAMEIVWSSIRLVWTKGVGWIKETWYGFRIWWSDMTTAITGVMIDAVAKIKSAWASAIGSIRKWWAQWEASMAVETTANIIAPIVAKLEGVDVAEVRKNLAEDFERRRKSLPERLAQIDRETKAEQKGIEDLREARQMALALSKKAFDEEQGRRIAALDDEVNTARARWRTAVDEAQRQRAAMLRGGAPERAGRPPGIPEFEGAMRQAGLTVGTFSKFALAGLAMGGGPAERTARNTERMAKDLEWLRRRSAVWAQAHGIARFGK